MYVLTTDELVSKSPGRTWSLVPTYGYQRLQPIFKKVGLQNERNKKLWFFYKAVYLFRITMPNNKTAIDALYLTMVMYRRRVLRFAIAIKYWQDSICRKDLFRRFWKRNCDVFKKNVSKYSNQPFCCTK